MRFSPGDRVRYEIQTVRPVVVLRGRGQIIAAFPRGDLAAVEVYRINPDDLGQPCVLAAEYEVFPLRRHET